MGQNGLKTRQEALAELARRGQSIRGWALANGLSPAVAHGVLNGKISGRIGAGHKVSVKLGIKEGEIVENGSHE